MKSGPINRSTLRRLAWVNGFWGIADLARHIKRSRAAIYAAVENPHQFAPTVALLEGALRNTTPNERPLVTPDSDSHAGTSGGN